MGRVRVTAALAALAVVLALVALLTGCGGSSSKSTSATSQASTSAAAAATQSTTAATQSTTAATQSTTATTSTTTTTSASSSAAAAAKPKVAMLTLSSPAFARGAAIPARYTCEGANQSPPLKWSKVPAGTKQLFLFALDLAGGAKGAVRWAVADIAPSVEKFDANSIPAGAVVGRNSLGKAAWAGICPTQGKPHNLVFLLYALSKKLTLANGFEPKTVQRELTGNTLGAGVLFGISKHA